MPHDVFISYSSKDKLVADRVCHALEAQGERCWIAPRDIPYGADWQEAIMSALAGAGAMVLVFTGNTNESAHVRREVSAALEAGAIVIPLRTEEATPQGALRYNLINLHWMDAISPPLESHIADLIKTLKRLRAAPEVGSTNEGPKRRASHESARARKLGESRIRRAIAGSCRRHALAPDHRPPAGGHDRPGDRDRPAGLFLLAVDHRPGDHCPIDLASHLYAHQSHRPGLPRPALTCQPGCDGDLGDGGLRQQPIAMSRRPRWISTREH